MQNILVEQKKIFFVKKTRNLQIHNKIPFDKLH